jgi:uncharacterized protein (DUF1778 family)
VLLENWFMMTGRPPKNSRYVPRQRVNFRLYPELLTAIRTAAQEKQLTITDYVTMSVLAQLSRDGQL